MEFRVLAASKQVRSCHGKSNLKHKLSNGEANPMSFRKCLVMALALTLFTLVTLPLVAQTLVTGDLVGTVTDASGAVVPNATVTAKNNATGESQAVKSS